MCRPCACSQPPPPWKGARGRPRQARPTRKGSVSRSQSLGFSFVTAKGEALLLGERDHEDAVLTLAVGLSLASAAPGALAAPGREAQLQDLEVLRSQYVAISPVFTADARDRALAKVEALKSQAGAFSERQFTVGVMEVVALADNGHDEAGPMKGWQPALRSPIRILWLQDGMVITHAAADQHDLLGARITRVEGLTPEQLMARLRRVGGGTDAYRR